MLIAAIHHRLLLPLRGASFYYVRGLVNLNMLESIDKLNKVPGKTYNPHAKYTPLQNTPYWKAPPLHRHNQLCDFEYIYVCVVSCLSLYYAGTILRQIVERNVFFCLVVCFVSVEINI